MRSFLIVLFLPLLAASAAFPSPCGNDSIARFNDSVDRVSPDQRVFPVILEFQSALRVPADGDDTTKLLALCPADARWGETIALLEVNAKALEVLQSIRGRTAMGRYQGPTDSVTRPKLDASFSPLDVHTTHLGPIRTAHRLLWASARRAKEIGKQQVAADALAISIELAILTAEEQMLISMLQGAICLGDAAELAGRIVAADPDFFTAESMSRLDAALAGALDRIRFTTDSERALVEDLLDRLYCSDGKIADEMSEANAFEFFLYMRKMLDNPNPPTEADRAVFREKYGKLASRTEMLNALDQLFRQHDKLLRSTLVDPYLKQVREFEEKFWSGPPDRFLVLGVFLPGFDKLWRSREHAFLQIESARLALQLAIDRRTRGTWAEPDTKLPSTNPPLDRYTAKPLRYRIENGRPLIYSLGPDQLDQQGRQIDELQKRTTPIDPKRAGDIPLWPKPLCDKTEND